MDGICNLLKPVLESEHSVETLNNLLSSCADQRAFSLRTSGVSSFVGMTNARLNEPSSRHEGLLLLQTFLPQCSQEVLSQNGSTWIQFCLKGISNVQTARLSFIVFKMLIKLSVTVPELAKHVSSVVIASFVDQIHRGILPQASLYALECLEECMRKYNGPCGPHRKVIERFLLSFMDYSGPQLLEVFWQAARNIAMLPQIGGGGVGGNQYKLAWAAQQKSICRTMHILLDDLYADTNELQVTLMGGMLEGVEPLQLAQIEEADAVRRTQKLVARHHALSACLQAMLVTAFPVPKNVSISCIMNLICRGLAVNGSSMGSSNTTHSLALCADLPKVHYSLLKLLEALILAVRTNLLPFAGLICRLGMQTLKWTQVDDWPYGTEKPFCCLRIQAYEVLKLWSGVAKGGSLMDQVSQQFIDLALPDIYSEKDSVLLSAGSPKKNQRHVKQKAAASPGVPAVLVSQDWLALNKTANKYVCDAALQAVTAMVMSASFKIQAGVHKILQETVVAILIKVSTKSELPIPYTEVEPRLKLYQLLLQLVLDGHTVWPAPTNIAVKLFASGLHDADAQISMFCGMALSAVEKIIHPAHPSLSLAPDQKELRACIKDTVQNQELPSIVIFEDQETTSDPELDSAFISSRNEEPKHSNVCTTSTEDSSNAYSVQSVSKTHGSSTKNKNGQSITEINQKMKHVNVSERTDSPLDVSNPSKLVLKLSPVIKKVEADTNDDEIDCAEDCFGSARRTIDLTASDISDDDISEVPCEIDLANSEDEKNSVSNEMAEKDSVFEKEVCSHVEVGANAASHVEQSCVPVSVDMPPKAAVEDQEESAKRAAEEEEEEGGESASKKQKVTDDSVDFASDEDSMLLSFVDVTRDEEGGDLI